MLREVGPAGPRDAKIILVGEAPSTVEIQQGIPFVGPAGEKLNSCLHQAGLIRAHCYITNLIPYQIDNIGVYYNSSRGALTTEGLKQRDRLAEELASLPANVVVALGNPAACALTGKASINERRGYIVAATEHFNNRKVLPTIHPASVLYASKGRGNPYFGMYYIAHDLKKAAIECEFPHILYDGQVIKIPASFEEALAFLKEIKTHKRVAVDIETIEFEVACIGFAVSRDLAYVIPLHKAWTEDQEHIIWLAVEGILADESITKIGHNFIYDRIVLLRKNHVQVCGITEDTMLAHSVVYPDFRKSLAFLASIYTNLPYWKDMAKFKASKEEE